ncbi:hypothetical protein C8R45DRAFT_949779 [Mycena sanguinolenta]|nr:hypothetical protein C8R45DRAFT_949779 [Mycena sanguinolenta]
MSASSSSFGPGIPAPTLPLPPTPQWPQMTHAAPEQPSYRPNLNTAPSPFTPSSLDLQDGNDVHNTQTEVPVQEEEDDENRWEERDPFEEEDERARNTVTPLATRHDCAVGIAKIMTAIVAMDPVRRKKFFGEMSIHEFESAALNRLLSACEDNYCSDPKHGDEKVAVHAQGLCRSCYDIASNAGEFLEDGDATASPQERDVRAGLE